jgi:L-threonylcarbamoyladenylate synthase
MRTTEEFYEKTGERTIAVRMPNHKIALKLISEYGVLRSTSLNKSGDQPLKDIKQINELFGSKVSKIHEQTYNQSDLSSTVIDMTGNAYVVLREGNIKKEDLDLELKEFVDFLNRN